MEANPYAPPQANLQTTAPVTEAETIRQEHISTEVNLKTIGGLSFLIGLFCMTVGMLYFPAPSQRALFHGLFIIGIGLIQFVTGYYLYKLKPIVRWPATGVLILIIVATLFVGSPFPALMGSYFLYVLNNKRGRFILSPEYKAIVDATPHVKRRSSGRFIVKAMFVIFAVLILIGILGYFLA